MSIAADLNYDELSFDDIKCRYHVGRSSSTSPGRGHKKETKYTEYMLTNMGEIEVSEWQKAAKALINRHSEEELFKNLMEYYSEPKGVFNEQYVLECYVSRIFDNKEWVGFIPFNQKFRPKAMRGVVLIKVKCECCDKPGHITEAQYEARKNENKCFCPICGRFSKMEVEKMRKINSFIILNLTMKGFKCFKDKIEFDFGDMTFVKGANGLGKSSIADAVSFAFTGTTFFGEKGLDKFHNPKSPEMEVSVKLVDDNGEIHMLTRTHKNDTTTISFDGYNVRQADMNEMFGDRDLFLSMFNPLYLIDTLGTDGKELLEKMLPFVEHEAVLKALGEPLKSEMKDEKILSPETYIKNRRAEIREQENDLVYLQGQSDLHESDVKKSNEAIQQLNEDIDAVFENIEALETERNTNLLSMDDEEQLVELYRRLDESTADKEDETATYQLLRDIQAKEIEIATLAAAVYQPSFTVQIAEKSVELKALYQGYAEINGLISKVQPGYQCPSCFHEVTDENLAAVKCALQNKLRQCVEAGKQAKNELTGFENEEKTAERLFSENAVKKMAVLDDQLLKMKGQHQAAEADKIFAENERTETISKLNEAIQLLEDRKVNGNLTLTQLQELDGLRQKQRGLEAQLEIYRAVLDKPNFKEQIAETEKEIGRLKVLVNNAILYIGKKNELIFKGLNMNRVEILLYEIVKSTGEIKDTFKFTYSGKEYKRLSLSEKVRAGLEVAELIKKRSGRNFPTFIDNSESICVIDNVRPTSQLIFALVERNRPLTVTQKETALRKAG